MATDTRVSIPDPSVTLIDPRTGRLTRDGYRIISEMIQAINKLLEAMP